MSDDELDSLLRKVAHAPSRLPDARYVDARYELGKRLGEGGFGTVYEAFDRVRGELVALKLLRSASSEALLRFKREFRLVAGVADPGIVRLHDLHSDGERWYFTMERVDGIPFDVAARDPDALRDVFDGLVATLGRLHGRGWVHRDVKPANVLVERGGRVVLLDFGLLRLDADRASTTIVGTPAYVAPEVLAGSVPTPAADWYAVGVMLYEALTGETPFDDGSPANAGARRSAGPHPVRLRAPNAPADLALLCDQLLEPDPARRAVPGRLGVRRAASARGPFVGRASELAELARAVAQRPCVVRVVGASGVGKSALVERFAEEERARGTRVLFARCHARVHVPFGAIDGAVDELARTLARLPPARARAVAPRDAAALSRAFPVLETIAGFEGRARPGSRSRIGPAFSELLDRLGGGDPWLLVIDDAQWGDADSAAVAGELLQDSAPPVAIVLVQRSDGVDGPFVEGLAQKGIAIAVGAMPDADARELARSAGAATDVETIVREAAGHPLLVVELACDRNDGGAARTLADVIRTRMEAQTEPARRCARLAAIAAVALPTSVIARLGIPARAVDELHDAKLLTRDERDSVRIFHDRVREVIVSMIDDSAERELHREMAQALGDVLPERAEARSFHLAAAGELADAAVELLRAARGATAARAFAEARALYQRLLSLRARAHLEDGLERAIRIEAAEASARVGRSVEAAEGFIAASRLAAGESDVLMLRLRAAEQLLCAGHIERGEAIFDAELRTLGLSIGRTVPTQLAGVVRDKFGARVDPLRPRPTSEARLDALWTAFRATVLLEPVRSIAIGTRLVREAARPGATPHARLAAALITGLADVGPRGADPLARALDRVAAALVDRDDPRLLQLHALAEGLLKLGGLSFTGARTALARVVGIADEHGLGQSPEEAQARAVAGACAWMLGDVGYLRTEIVALRAEFAERDHLVGWMLASMHCAWLTAMERGVDAAERELDVIARRWTSRGLDLQAWWFDIARLHFALIRGDGRTAWALSHPHARRYRERLFGTLMHRLEAQIFLARSAICLARAGKASPDEISRAHRIVSELTSVPSAWTRASAHCLRAGLASVTGDLDGAVAALRAAEPVLEDAGMLLLQNLVRDVLGTLVGGDEGKELVRGARAELAAWRVDRDRAIACTLPGAW